MIVEVSGPGHHDRAGRAGPVIAALTAGGLTVSVETDLRPRLADDLRALLDAGAHTVRLAGPGVHGDLAADRTPLPAHRADVVVVLRPAPEARVEVVGEGEAAARARALLPPE